MRRTIVLKQLALGSIQVDIDELVEMMKKAAEEKGLNLETMTTTEKIALLKAMGYEEYFTILKKETEFSWL